MFRFLLYSGALNRLLWALFLLLISIGTGILLFYTVGKYSFVNAFYMTIITISTIGFGEIEPLSPTGRMLTSIYILINLGIFAYFISIITRYVLEGELQKAYIKYMYIQELSKLHNHVIVCGYGRNGRKACEELMRNKYTFVVIESDAVGKGLPNLSRETFSFVEGDATQDDVLRLAGIMHARAIITALPKDADNVYIALTAREFNPDITIIARATDESAVKKLYRAGANHVVMPDYIGGMHMAHHITQPEVVEFLEMLSGTGEVKLKMQEISYRELKSEFRDKSIRELNIRKHTHVTVLGFKHAGKGFIINPGADLLVHEGDVLIILGTEDDLDTFRKMYANAAK
ncbi:potassium channel protein [Rhodocytophaga rosea]|uniref:Potassium channel protein n=1 Tax=Rhodocytophaga rosea TaxID=2704465 RepID=A0A6C0GJE4_9BACT|nr:potassium channel protein [Rhodocytophaga rosea]QHT67803.1 potassium channel protein [Rhodocytophaga rosea]